MKIRQLGDVAIQAVIVLLAVTILLLGVNKSIENQTRVLNVQVSTTRALSCVLSLPLGPSGRDPVQAAACWNEEGLSPPGGR